MMTTNKNSLAMTIRIYFLLISFSFVYSTSNDDYRRDLGSRIILGEVANATRYPYYTYLDILRYSNSRGRCGGSLVASDMVLTAAHCLKEDKPITSITARVNYTQSIDVTGQLTGYEYSRIVTRRIVYPYYNWLRNEGDLGLLLLDTPVTEVLPVNLNNLWNSPYASEPLTVVGHGTMTNGIRDRPDYLMEVSVPTISHEDCNDRNSYDGAIIDRAMICAGAGGKDSCSGDSGGPLVILGTNSSEDIQVGIVSFGRQCGLTNFPGIYTRVSNYLEWIQTTICETSNDKPSYCVGDTPSPTPNPTMSPTRQPTRARTRNPTKNPTRNRTKKPTPFATTVSPTIIPTGSPTTDPLAAPTEPPTETIPSLPTVTPTEAPPTDLPVEIPTNPPTDVTPTNVPLEVPTDVPTGSAPNAPTDIPTDSLSNPPTIGPIDVTPTLPPTEAPTNAATNAPSTSAPVGATPTSSPTGA
jgi:trypsin